MMLHRQGNASKRGNRPSQHGVIYMSTSSSSLLATTRLAGTAYVPRPPPRRGTCGHPSSLNLPFPTLTVATFSSFPPLR
ncbi:hypothetical protein PVAP13_2KG229300 [Panicum virgatum]|uniref:Uncharacterized protein n=1 Tax=Panicum virgatum TaxID=38727 RepID=A0A8T0VX77_PANVG|nr:hypothetical protein PVAP13_2KG229300 [Panicum virgatum]